MRYEATPLSGIYRLLGRLSPEKDMLQVRFYKFICIQFAGLKETHYFCTVNQKKVFADYKMELSQIYIYRMTHIENIPHILENGITHKNSPNANSDYISIGDASLIGTRATKRISISNGNRTQSLGDIVLGDFIPFYFGVRMPMLYVMQHGGNCVERATPKEDIVYLACRLSDIIQFNTDYYFSDGHATDNFSLFYDASKIGELPNIIDKQAITAHFWNENLDIKRKKQAEFLVAGDIPPNCLSGFVCCSETSRQRLIGMGVESSKIKVYPQAYF